MAERGWAIVTGASGGIGAVFSNALAKRGHPVLAVARREAALQSLKEQIEASGGTCDFVAADLGTTEGVDAVVAAAEARDVELLVNNAGLSTTGDFLAQSYEKERTSIRLNIEAVHALTRRLLPAMVEKNRGGVINVASVVGFQAIPYWTTYAATKAFVLAFGEGLAHEMRHTKVRIVTVCPGFTKTGLYAETGVPGLAGKLLPMATPEKVVQSALSAYDGGAVIRVVGFMNKMLTLAGPPTPRPILRWLMGLMFAPDKKAELPSKT